MKILCVVVVYNPDEDYLIKNINAIKNKVDKLVIWDNSPGGCNFKVNNIPIYYTEKNEGLSRVYNFFVKLANREGYTHIMTMDQDSVWHHLDLFLEKVKNIGKNAIFCPSHTSEIQSKEFREIDIFINSGTLIPVNILNKVGGYNSDFFLDTIDTELCFHILKHNYKIYEIGNCYLEHNLGDPLPVKFLGFISCHSSNRPPIRYYDVNRNFIILGKMYKLPFSLKKFIFKTFIVRRLFNILFLENNKKQRLKAYCFGLFDGIFSRPSRVHLFADGISSKLTSGSIINEETIKVK